MKTSFDPEDIQALAKEVVGMIKPLLKCKCAGQQDTVLDVPGIAAYLKVDESWVYKQVQLKTIPHFKAGKGGQS